MLPIESGGGGLIFRVVSAGLLALLVACARGGQSTQTTALTPVAAVASAESKLTSGSAQTVQLRGTTSLANLGDVQLSGVEQFAPTLAADLKMTFSGSQLGALSNGSMEVILKDNIAYLNLGTLGTQLTNGKPWLKLDLSSLANLPGSAGSLSSLTKVNQNTDPAEQMRLLLASGHLTRVGTETVDGVRSTHYAGTVDPAKELQQQVGSNLTPEDVSRLKNGLQEAGITSEHIDLWLSQASLPVEIKVSAKSTAAGQIATDVHFSDWGRPVTITAPPADQVADISQLGAPGSGSP